MRFWNRLIYFKSSINKASYQTLLYMILKEMRVNAMTVYIVKASEGRYEDRYEWTIGAYSSKERAENEKDNYNNKLKFRYQLEKQCCNCPIHPSHQDVEIENEISKQKFIDRLRNKCEYADIYFLDKYPQCKNLQFIYELEEIDEAWIVELEVE